jgi:S-adenosylmethionine:tRNA ribosyltransferase-isomerase
MKTAEYDFRLPEELIASRPLEKRDSSRLLVLHKDGRVEHRKFSELPLFLNAGDMLLLNNTKVFPARLSGMKSSGGRLELLLVDEVSPGLWNILTKGRYTGLLRISQNLSAYVSEGRTAFFENHGELRNLLWKEGEMPLPPYIKRSPDKEDKERYQTVYAEAEGSIAAPTAGLHFTKPLLDKIASASVLVRTLTLHVGTGTFRPVKTDTLEDHVMEKEYFEMGRDLPAEIEEVKRKEKRIVAVGTTTTRAVEGYLSGKCSILPSNGVVRGCTDIFIHEGYRVRAVDSLITNFHLPRSTPLMLTAVFSGRGKLLKTYETAISMGYRFFSYGDAMLVL